MDGGTGTSMYPPVSPAASAQAASHAQESHLEMDQGYNLYM